MVPWLQKDGVQATREEETAAHKIEGQLSNDNFRIGARVLARMSLSFEAWLNFPQLPELAEFARDVPGLSIILNHVGGPLRVGPGESKLDHTPDEHLDLDEYQRAIQVLTEALQSYVSSA